MQSSGWTSAEFRIALSLCLLIQIALLMITCHYFRNCCKYWKLTGLWRVHTVRADVCAHRHNLGALLQPVMRTQSLPTYDLKRLFWKCHTSPEDRKQQLVIYQYFETQVLQIFVSYLSFLQSFSSSRLILFICVWFNFQISLVFLGFDLFIRGWHKFPHSCTTQDW